MSEIAIVWGGILIIIGLFLIINWGYFSTLKKVFIPLLIIFLSLVFGTIFNIWFDLKRVKGAIIAGYSSPLLLTMLFTVVQASINKLKYQKMGEDRFNNGFYSYVFISIFLFVSSIVFAITLDDVDFVNENAKSIKWETIEDDEFGVSIDFPLVQNLSLEEENVVVEDTEFGDVLRKDYTLNCQNVMHENLAYSLAIYKFPVGSFQIRNEDEVREYFDKTESAIASFSGAVCFQRVSSTVHGYPSREFWFQNEKHDFRIKAISVLKNDIEFRYFVITPTNNYLRSSINIFLNSFTLDSIFFQ